jgi:hypothetical protein
VIICIASPAYQQRVHIGTAFAIARDMAAAKEMGWRVELLSTDVNNIEVARNTIVDHAVRMGARLLMMIDADTMPIPREGGLASMWRAMHENGAAYVGAAVPVRNGNSMNCEPAEPGCVYPGVCGTGYCLLDLHRLRDLPRPWFTVTLAEDGMSKAVGSDIGFCRRIQEAGHVSIVNFGLGMAHAETVATATRF